MSAGNPRYTHTRQTVSVDPAEWGTGDRVGNKPHSARTTRAGGWKPRSKHAWGRGRGISAPRAHAHQGRAGGGLRYKKNICARVRARALCAEGQGSPTPRLYIYIIAHLCSKVKPKQEKRKIKKELCFVLEPAIMYV